MVTQYYRKSHQACKEITKRNGKTFYFISKALPQKKREAAYAIYAFFRFAVDGLERATSSGEQAQHLKKCNELLDRIYSNRTLDFVYPFEWAFEQALMRYGIPKRLFYDLMTGLVLDANFQQPQTEDDLLHYTYHIAGSLGLVLTYIFGATTHIDSQAISLANAMCLTSMIQELRTDAAKGRVFIPQSWLEEFGLSKQDIVNLSNPNLKPKSETADKLWEVEQKFISLCEKQYQQALAGIPYLRNDGSRFCVALLSSFFWALLTKIKRRGASGMNYTFHIGFFEKISLVPKAMRIC